MYCFLICFFIYSLYNTNMETEPMNTTLTQAADKTVWLNVPVTADLRKRIKIAAAERDQTAREFMLDAVKAFIASEESKAAPLLKKPE